MIRPWAVVGCLLLATVPVRAQSQKWEVYGGYQFSRFKLAAANQMANGNGWDAALSYSINDWVAAKVDVGGSYSSGATLPGSISSGPASLHTYMLGPTFSARGEHVTPFVEILIGGYRDHVQILGPPVGGWSLMGGGGADVHVAKHLAWRLETDWIGLMSGFPYSYQHQYSKTNFRFSTGLVIRF